MKKPTLAAVAFHEYFKFYLKLLSELRFVATTVLGGALVIKVGSTGQTSNANVSQDMTDRFVRTLFLPVSLAEEMAQ